jgi:hypothetical protein
MTPCRPSVILLIGYFQHVTLFTYTEILKMAAVHLAETLYYGRDYGTIVVTNSAGSAA